ncbi:sigma-70 family RNA polymerase sigma factor [bacterium]|nr:MAG: sigma-70 family RNA polymerase sigma factor [bacterium]
MQDIDGIIAKAQSGDLDAYNQIVLGFQDMAVAYGYSVTGDFHLAEDAAQEAFIEALSCLQTLREAKAFPGWLRRIVFKHCDRATRNKQVPLVSLSAASEEINPADGPDRTIEKRELAWQVRKAIANLSPPEREATLLFYGGEYSQKQIAEFIEVPVSTVKKRLYTARGKIKEMMIQTMQENFDQIRPSINSEFAERVKTFTAQFSQMIDSGQSIVQSLAALSQKEPSAEWSQVIAQVQRDITGDGREGATLSEAMAKHPAFFSQNYIEVIRQGEIEGNLAVLLQRSSIHQNL